MFGALRGGDALAVIEPSWTCTSTAAVRTVPRPHLYEYVVVPFSVQSARESWYGTRCGVLNGRSRGRVDGLGVTRAVPHGRGQ